MENKVKKPVVKNENMKTDYYIEFQKGDFYAGKTIQRAIVVRQEDFDRVQYENKIEISRESKTIRKIVKKVEDAPVMNGFGVTINDALEDFIDRNKANVLDAIFDIKLGE